MELMDKSGIKLPTWRKIDKKSKYSFNLEKADAPEKIQFKIKQNVIFEQNSWLILPFLHRL